MTLANSASRLVALATKVGLGAPSFITLFSAKKYWNNRLHQMVYEADIFCSAFEKKNWSGGDLNFLQFTLFKENLDTMKAIGILADGIRMNSRSFAYAGNKDKRAVTTQVWFF